jgi:hypothetical protein
VVEGRKPAVHHVESLQGVKTSAKDRSQEFFVEGHTRNIQCLNCEQVASEDLKSSRRYFTKAVPFVVGVVIFVLTGPHGTEVEVLDITTNSWREIENLEQSFVVRVGQINRPKEVITSSWDPGPPSEPACRKGGFVVGEVIDDEVRQLGCELVNGVVVHRAWTKGSKRFHVWH